MYAFSMYRKIMSLLRCHRSCVKYGSFVGVVLLVFYIIFSDPSFRRKPCTPVLHMKSTRDFSMCRDILAGKSDAIAAASEFAWCKRSDVITEERYSTLALNCDRLHKELAYPKIASEEEKSFPLAFSILTHENLEQTERLLRLIYRPHNVYCVHVDAKSPAAMHRAAAAIASCFDNVLVAEQSIDIHWAEFSLLEAELVCLRQLLSQNKHWKYYMNLMSREFPLKTNLELVRILRAYNGANDVDGTMHTRPILWTQFVWKNENWRTSTLKSPAPHELIIAKGSTHVAVTRAFADYALHNKTAQDLLEWMRDIRAPDEHFFPTLNHNPFHGVPGAYKGDPDLKWFYARLKIWQSKEEVCHGQWLRYVCNLGVGDLARLPAAKHLFVNKIRLEQDPTAFMCLEYWYHGKVKHEAINGTNQNLNLTFYANLPFVLNHV